MPGARRRVGRAPTLAEGVWTAAAIHRLAADLEIGMPISAAVNAVPHAGADVDEALRGLLARPFTAEAAAGV